MPQRLIYWKEEPKERAWKLTPADNPKVMDQVIKKGAMFTTWMSFSEPYEGNGAPEPVRYGDFPLDFDDSNDISAALKDVRALCFYHIPSLYGVDPYAIQFFLSGGKGFHAVIPNRLFAAQGGDPYLPLMYKKIALQWKEQFKLETLDTSLYCMGKGKMFRIANVKRANGFYKVPLMMEELQNLEPEKLKDLGCAPREIYHPEVDLDPNIDLAGLFQTCRDEVYRENEKHKSKPPAPDRELPKDLPPCIRYIIAKEPKTAKTTFNKLVVNLVTYFQAAGYSENQAYELINPFIQNYPHSQSYPTPEARAKHFEDQRRYLKDHQKYTFECSYIRGMGFAGSAFDCRECPLNGRGKQKEKAAKTAKALTELEEERIAIQEEPRIAEEPAEKVGESINFPEEVISGVAGEAVDLFSKYIESPKQFIYMTFLTFLGAVISRMVSLKSVVDAQTRLYTVLIGPSGRSRKSTVISLLANFFKDVLTKDFGLEICWGVGSDIGLLRRMKKANSLILTLDEFRALTSKSAIQASALLPAIATLFDRNEYSNYTKKDSIYIKNGHLSMIAASTAETFEEIWSSDFTNIGLNNRLFLCPGSGEKAPLPTEIPPQEYKSLLNGIGRMLEVVGGSLKVSLSTEAEEAYNSWYMNLENSIHSQRLEAYCLRLACILAVNEKKFQVDLNIIQKAISLCDWQLIMRKLHDPVAADNVISELEQKIRRDLGVYGQMTARQLRQSTNADRRGLYYFKNAVKNLMDAGDVIEIKPDKKTKQRAKRYQLVEN